MNYIIPTSDDATAILENRVLIITGVGRSGTTILGKLIGSMSPVYYLFEPAIMKWLTQKHQYIDFGSRQFTLDNKTFESIQEALDLTEEQYSEKYQTVTFEMWMRAVIFEDYILPIVQGRHLNDNPEDLTYWRDYYTEDEIVVSRKYLNRRQDAIEFLKLRRPLFVIKSNEFQPLIPLAEKIFPRCRFIHIIRNGNDVINSAIGRDWYTDEWCNHYMIDWAADGEVKAPWYLDKEDVQHWPKWKPITRAACAWRYLVHLGLIFLNQDYRREDNLFYEPLINDPESCVDNIRQYFDLKITANTERHINSIHAFEQKIYSSIVNDIEEPERSRFRQIMGRCDYE